jgi:6-pyruvoyltetrahydropterin/6-carboxytetrahydropterin synthase
MYRLKIIDSFSAAHQLHGYAGNCEALHGHNWKVEVQVRGEHVNGIGIVIDFKDLKRLTKRILDQFDHGMLNEHEAFRDCNPSSELIARHVYRELARELPGGVAMEAVTVWESDNAAATYSEP